MTTSEQTSAGVAEQTSGFTITLRGVTFVLLALAIIVSGYLSYLKIASGTAVCLDTGKFDCGTVLNSAYSEMGGIPIAWLGLAVNLTAVTLLLLETRVAFFEQFTVTLVFGLELFAFLFSMYLIYVQAALIKAYCPWCLSHEALITLIFIMSSIRLRQRMIENG